MNKLSSIDKKAYQDWLSLCEQIRTATPVTIEDQSTKDTRIAALRQDFEAFAKYYFPHYLDSDFAWFHKKAAKDIYNDTNIFAVLEWPREHAKSVFADIFIPLFLYANNQLSGVVISSANETKAKILLGDLQAEFVSNNRWISDYGELAKIGDWQDGAFSTNDGIGFWALGRGQSPRGIRKGANRPNYAVVDDIDDKIIVRNPQRVKETVDWIIEDLFGALSIKASRIIIVGNRIHKASILAHMVGDVNTGDPKIPGRYHLKVFAFEKTTTHTKADHITGRPAWKERYTPKMLIDKMTKMGHRSARREYFHEHHEEGNVFKNQWIEYTKPIATSRYTNIVIYCDPSFKDTEKSDYKAIITVGAHNGKYHIIDTWVRQASVKLMVEVFYDLYAKYQNHARYYIEANMLQDLLLDEFTQEGNIRDLHLPIRADRRAKPNKYLRIENMSPLFERGLIRIDQDIQQTPDTQEFINQLLGFPYGHDDAPDALEGALHYITKYNRSSGRSPRYGTYTVKSKYKE
ncbi:MAG TPA: hypothetical protein PK047_06895 [Saprospiraceae bacterium]|nr:hypothetical protein [Saprospiraceae bacterium]HRP41964.1 hypothetical protein [Saprospiraceae bacterium]